ncbi:hypothetical protein [Noviherbaspirillum sp. ST9]|uniref:hypothetical protein n=1 Tax=Noviherbaspirillum sp. ST9 TaxID=3401606 RepID=UPI003B58A798
MYSCLLAAALLSACASDVAMLRPAPEATRADTTGAAQSAVGESGGVRVLATARAWPGRVPVEDVITPLRLRIDNNSSRPVLVRYDRIMLAGASGKGYAALPPYEIDATVSVPRLTPGHPVIVEPGFVAHGFAVSPLYAPVYPGYSTIGGPYAFDPMYYSSHGRYWRNVPVTLPTREMLRLALPEGRIAPGGGADGFVYFEKVAKDAQRVRLRVEILDADKGSRIGIVEIPFIVTAG